MAETNTTLSEQAKEARRAYKRQWAHEHPDKVRESQYRYWEKRAADAAAKEVER